MSVEHKIANALHNAALKLEHAIESGHRDASLDANDFIETLVSIADEVDPPVAPEPPTLLDAALALLEARENQMVTRVEWDELARAVATAGE